MTEPEPGFVPLSERLGEGAAMTPRWEMFFLIGREAIRILACMWVALLLLAIYAASDPTAPSSEVAWAVTALALWVLTAKEPR